MAKLEGFWSYVHADDEADGGRIRKLAQDVISEYEMMTGDSINLFFDCDVLRWGDEWETVIDSELSSVAFFIATITPRFFQSHNCRKEIRVFSKKAEDLGLRELILPVLYVDVPQMSVEDSSDDLMELVKSYQWDDWRDLRFSDPMSGEYRKGVNRLARRLVDANMKVESDLDLNLSPLLSNDEIEQDDSPGLVDRIATMEESWERLNSSLSEVGSGVSTVGDMMTDASRQLRLKESQGKGFSAKASINKKLALRLNPVADRMLQSANDFVSTQYDVDSGMRALFEIASMNDVHDPDTRDALCGMMLNVINLMETVNLMHVSSSEYINTLSELEPLSRDLRSPLRKLRKGVSLTLEAKDVVRGWVELSSDLNIDC